MKRLLLAAAGVVLMVGSATVFALVVDRPAIPAKPDTASAARLMTIYRSPTCSCCKEYETYLRAEGYSVRSIEVTDTGAFKQDRNIPHAAWSCHTGVIDGYIVEGHVPVAAIDRLLSEQPPVDGIALPEMPAGAPGMGGTKQGPLDVVSFDGETIAPFMTF